MAARARTHAVVHPVSVTTSTKRDPAPGTLRILAPSELRGTSACACYGQPACRTCHGSGRTRAISHAALIRAYLELRTAYLALLRHTLRP